MKGDFTRSTFRPQRHYRSVRMQQGRVQTDADWNEQADLAARRSEVGSQDVIGSCGAPLENPGFGLLGGADPRLTAGHMYVDGILCENDAEIELDRQPDYPGFTLPSADGFYLAYLDAFAQHVTALEDELIREVALGGPDTTTRQRTAWQVRLLGPYDGPLHCGDDLEDWTDLVNRPLGGLRARTNPGSVSSDPCIISPGGGYRRLENQLYRVEIHTPGARGTARFKWSRDNGAIVTAWLEQQGSDLLVGSLGRDQVLGFAPGQTVEVIDDGRELRGEAGILVRLSGAEGQSLTMDSTDPATATVDKADFPDMNNLGAPNHPKVRRWDSDGTLLTGAGWIALEDGVEVSFEAGEYQVGDYWLIPARTATDDVEWPREADGDPIPQPPHGVQHHYCRLAVLERAAGSFTVVEDCRPLFPPLTGLLHFSYLGGDGQESLPTPPALPLPDNPLPEPLRVGVTLGSYPLGAGPLAGVHYQVEFTTDVGGHLGAAPAGIASQANAYTVAVVDGEALCYWQLDGGDGSRAALSALRSQTVTARLLDSAGVDTGLPPLVFNASLSLASQVEFHPQEECSSLSGVTTVEEAIDRLCLVQQVAGRCCVSVGEGGDFVTLEEAIRALVEQGELHICLCLLPGEHTTAGIELGYPGTAPAHLRINGGANALLRLQGRIRLDRFASLVLDSLTIVAGEIGNAIPYIAFSNCGLVVIRNCQLAADAGSGVLLGIDALTGVLLENNQIEVVRRSTAPGGALGGTLLVDAFQAVNRTSFAMLATGLARETFSSMRVRDRRAVSNNVRSYVEANDATLTASERDSLLALANELNATRLELDIFNDHLLDILDLTSEPGRAMYIAAPRAQVTLRNNHIFGEVSFYGPSPEVQWDDDGLAALVRGMRVGISQGGIRLITVGGVLQMHNNRVTQVTWSAQVFDQIRAVVQAGAGIVSGLANTFIAGNNQFSNMRNIFVAEHIDLHHNVFFAPPETFLAACFGETGIYVGNRGPGNGSGIMTSHPDPNKAIVANLRMTID